MKDLRGIEEMPSWQLEQLRRDAGKELRRRAFEEDWEASWRDLEGKVVDREQATQNILAQPTIEERERWAGMTPEEVRRDIGHHLDEQEKIAIGQMRFVAEIDTIARQTHIALSPRLRRYR